MSSKGSEGAGDLTPAQRAMVETWDRHVASEFESGSIQATMETMTSDPLVNNVPVMTGGVGFEEVRDFYDRFLIPSVPEDSEMVPVSRTVGDDRIVDELVFRFTHSREMPFLLPGIPATGKPVEVPVVVVVSFEGGRVSREHIYWDQASVLAQLGLIDSAALPVAGVESARKVLDPHLPSNALLKRTGTER